MQISHMASGPQVVLGTQHSAGTFNGLIVLDRKESELKAIIKNTLLSSVQIIDTAPIYARGYAEEVIGANDLDRKIWTKVGVDITKALPALDYSQEGMVKSLKGSLGRLKRKHCDTAFIHNPLLSTLENIDTHELADTLCQKEKLCTQVGISTAGVDMLEYLAEKQPAGISILMLELYQLENDQSLLEKLSKKYILAARGIFRQGRDLRNMPAGEIPDFITERMDHLRKTYPLSYYVIGPRTIDQLISYTNVVGDWDMRPVQYGAA